MGKKGKKKQEEPDPEEGEEEEPVAEGEEVEVVESKEKSEDAAEGEGEGVGPSGTMTVQGTTQTRQIFMQYCPTCTAPFEYCEWGPDFAKCKAWFTENWTSAYPDVAEGDELVELMTRLGFEGKPDANAKKAQAAKKAPPAEGEGAPAAGAEGAPLSKKEAKKKAEQQVVIELATRNKKKHVTSVRGLEHFEVDVPAAAKTFGKKFACGSAFQKGKNGLPDQIEIQGNYKDELPAFIAEKLKIKLESIFVLEGGKKTCATDLPPP